MAVAAAPAITVSELADRRAENQRAYLRRYAGARGNLPMPDREKLYLPTLENLGVKRAEAKQRLADTYMDAGEPETAILRRLLSDDVTVREHAPTPDEVKKEANADKPLPKVRREFGRRAVVVTQAPVIRDLLQRGAGVGNALANQPLPAGLGGLFLLNLAFLALFPTSNGYSRAQLLLLTALNRTSLQYNSPLKVVPASPLAVALEDIAAATAAVGGVVANIGNAAGAAGAAIGNIPILGGILGGLGLSYEVPSSVNGLPPMVTPPPGSLTV